MTPFLQTQTLELNILTAATAIAGPLAGCKLDLYSNNVVYDPVNSVIGNFTICNYTGYTQVTITWAAPSLADDGNVEVVSNRGVFRPTDAVVPNQTYGYIVRDSGGALIGGGTFDGGPLNLLDALHQVDLAIRYRPFADGGFADVTS